MAVCKQVGQFDDVGLLLNCAQLALQAGDFRSTEALLAESLAIEPRIETWLLFGQCFLFQGQPESALSMYNEAWEAGKRNGCLKSRWQSCFGLSQVYSALQEMRLSGQYFSLAMTAVMEAWSSGSLNVLPEEVLLANALQLSADGQRMAALPVLHQLREFSTNPLVQSEAGFSYAELQSGTEQLSSYRTCCQIFRRLGNYAGILRALERLAELELSLGMWENGRKTLLEAKRIAQHLGIRTKVAHYQSLGGRLRHSLAVYHGENQQN